MRILAIGPLWRGSNAGGLFKALSRQGCLLEVVDEFYYISLKTKKKTTKIVEKLIRPWQFDEFNNAIIENIKKFVPDVLFVYKGAFVYPQTLQFAKNKNCKLVLFYPDVSMTAHGSNIPNSIPLYDLIFSTKTFGIKDLESKFNVHNSYFIPHGFDPEIHRKLEINDKDKKYFGCDVSFIGTWSPKKEKLLAAIKNSIPAIDLKIWGEQWDKIESPVLKSSIQYAAVFGDLYSVAIQCSKINLGILSEQVKGASSGDLITSRTFHIAGCSGFLLHEKNEESVLYYIENEEAGFFSDYDTDKEGVDLVAKVKYFLSNEALRLKIQNAGYLRALKEHSLDTRAKEILVRINKI